MGFNVPLINRDSQWVYEHVHSWTQSNQKKLVLVIVSIALLLDNMLYMVIVPIIPKYLREIHAYETQYEGGENITTTGEDGTVYISHVNYATHYVDEEVELGWLFASKALLQIFVNPLSGFIIDRIGYEIPMVIGLTVMFLSTSIFALGQSYGVLFFNHVLQVDDKVVDRMADRAQFVFGANGDAPRQIGVAG